MIDRFMRLRKRSLAIGTRTSQLVRTIRNSWSSVKFGGMVKWYIELDLELSESSLMSKVERKKQFVTNMQAINEKK